jgi:hypothetical protein
MCNGVCKCKLERDAAVAREAETWAQWESRVAALKAELAEVKQQAFHLRDSIADAIEAKADWHPGGVRGAILPSKAADFVRSLDLVSLQREPGNGDEKT